MKESIILSEDDKLLYAELKAHLQLLKVEGECIQGFVLNSISKKYKLNNPEEFKELLEKGRLDFPRGSEELVGSIKLELVKDGRDGEEERDTKGEEGKGRSDIPSAS